MHKRLVPLISCDYSFITQMGVFSRDELAEDERERALTVLILYCSATRSIFARAVPKKCLDPDGHIVEMIRNDVLWLGHPKVRIRRDNEPALLHVVDTALAAPKANGVTLIPKVLYPYYSQTNGAAERAVKLLKGSVRASLMRFERQLQARILLVTHLVWLMTYVAGVHTMRVRGPDGRTAHQRARGSGASIRFIPFGQK